MPVRDRFRREACRGFAAGLALAAIVVQTVLPALVAASWSGTASASSLASLVLCTLEGLRRIPVDRPPENERPSPDLPIFCPVCVVVDGPAVAAASPETICFTPAERRSAIRAPGEAEPRPTRWGGPPPVRGPPTA